MAIDRSRAGSLGAYFSVFTHSFSALLAYSASVWVNLLAMAAGFAFTFMIWHYAQPPGPAQAALFAYLALAFAANFSLGVAFERYVGERIREGLIATDLLKPVDYSWFFFCQASSDMVFQGLFGLAVLGLAFAFLGPSLLPASGAALALSVLSFALAFVVQFHLGFLFMQMIFATHSNYGPFTLRMLMHLTFSGVFAPIDYFPGWLGALAGWLPFRHVIYTPCAIYLGRLHGPQVLQALLSQLAWAVALALGSRLSFDLIRRHLTIQGG
jgi:ABC-type uncharacterized transport system permease subunit